MECAEEDRRRGKRCAFSCLLSLSLTVDASFIQDNVASLVRLS